MINIDETVKEISTSLSTAQQIEPFSKRGLKMSVEEAYAVAAQARSLYDDGAVVGRKIGFTNRGIWHIYGVDQPIWGDMRSSSVHFYDNGQAELDLSRFCEPRIEPEVVICLKDKLPVSANDTDIVRAIDWIAPGFEIVDSIYPNWSFSVSDAIATGSLHGCLLIGPKSKPTVQTATELLSLNVRLLNEGILVEEGRGANVLDGPISAIRFLMEGIAAMAGQRPLAAGDIITTGTVTDAKPISPGQNWRAEFFGILEGNLCLNLD